VDDGGVAHADRWNHWHGFTQMAAYRSWVIERGEGNWLIDSQGGRYLDGVSSMWCNVHGHRKREIDEAIIAQVGRVAEGLGQVPPPGGSRPRARRQGRGDCRRGRVDHVGLGARCHGPPASTPRRGRGVDISRPHRDS
jgi:hypothetical protein